MGKEVFDNNNLQENDTLNIKDELSKYIRYWKWFVLSVIVALIMGKLYVKKSTLLYSASSTIMIKNDRRSGMSAELAAFKELSVLGGGGNKNVDNEIQVLRSRKILSEVVRH